MIELSVFVRLKSQIIHQLILIRIHLCYSMLQHLQKACWPSALVTFGVQVTRVQRNAWYLFLLVISRKFYITIFFSSNFKNLNRFDNLEPVLLCPTLEEYCIVNVQITNCLTWQQISEMSQEPRPIPKDCVYPALVCCSTPVEAVLPQISSAMW